MLVVGIKILIVNNYFLHRISFSEAFFKEDTFVEKC